MGRGNITPGPSLNLPMLNMHLDCYDVKFGFLYSEISLIICSQNFSLLWFCLIEIIDFWSQNYFITWKIKKLIFLKSNKFLFLDISFYNKCYKFVEKCYTFEIQHSINDVHFFQNFTFRCSSFIAMNNETFNSNNLFLISLLSKVL